MAVKWGVLGLFLSALSLSPLEAQPATNGANEFYLAFSANGRTSQSGNVHLYIYVTTAESNPVQFYVNTVTETGNHTVSRDNTTLVTLDYNDYSCRNERVKEFKGIHIKAEPNKTISAYAINYRDLSSEAFVALPCQQFPVSQYVYYSMSTSSVTGVYSSAEGFALIVACEDSTEVSTPTHTISLDRRQTYLLRDNDDITGIRFESNKPIVLLSGHECGVIDTPPSCDYGRCCGPLVEQIPPTVSWGTVFLTASLTYVGYSDQNTKYRILAAHDNTNVQMSCSMGSLYSTTLSSGSFEDIYRQRDDTCVISSDKPILVAEFGWTFMFTIPPIESYLNTYSFYVISIESHITISMLAATGISPQETVIYLDEKRLVADWKVLAADGHLYGYITTITVRSGRHYLSPKDENVKLHVTVHDNFSKDYGYPAGYALKAVALGGYCDPSCVNGECTEGDVCNCNSGYKGEVCDQSVMSECYVDSCDEGEENLLCSKNATSFACECPQDFQPITCDDFWNDSYNESLTCNCTSYESVAGCSLTQSTTECPADVSVCLSGAENCTRFILKNFQCNCSGGEEPINDCDIACPSQHSTATPPTTPDTTQPYSENCLEEPCLNDGTCIYDYNYDQYSCSCTSEYTGSRCQDVNYYNSDDSSDDSSNPGAIVAAYVIVFLGIPFCVLPGCGGVCYCVFQYKRHGSRLFKRSSVPRAGQRNNNGIQNRGRFPPEIAEPLIQDLPEEYQWNLGPPRAQPLRREEESSRDQMVPIERVNEILEPFIQQQDQRWQDDVGVAVIPFMSEKPQLHHLRKLVSEAGEEVKIVDIVAYRLEDVAFALRFTPAVCRAVLRGTNNDYRLACLQVFEKWLNGEGLKPVTWATLIQALDDADFKELAKELKNIVKSDGIR